MVILLGYILGGSLQPVTPKKNNGEKMTYEIHELRKQIFFLLGYSGLGDNEELWSKYADEYGWLVRPE